jgi:hypothetical protein
VDGFINEATVLGQDLFGRFTVNQAMDIWSLAATRVSSPCEFWLLYFGL